LKNKITWAKIAAKRAKMQKTKQGYKIILTADRTLMSEYNGGIFLGFSACVPQGIIPDALYFAAFSPSVPANKDGAAKFAPCGSRKMEAKLLDSGVNREDIIVAHPDQLEKVIGPATKVICITENDPLGLGPATSTFRQLFGGGEAYMTIKFREILNNPAIQKYKPKIIVGGAGAWQLESEERRSEFGVDTVVIGEGEKVIAQLCNDAIAGNPLPGMMHGPVAELDEISSIQGPTVNGIVEIARGCGRGCAFCVPTLQRFRCASVESILKEVDYNLKYGQQPLLHAEDVLRYKANGFEINQEAVKELFSRVYNYPGVKAVGISHFALASVCSAPDLISDLSEILEVPKTGARWMSGQCGIETGSPKIIGNMMAGKAKPFKPDEWPQVVEDAYLILNKNNWVPLSTLIIGLPGETDQDVQLTIDLVSRLKPVKSIIVPLFMVGEGGLNKTQSFQIDNISIKQSELFLKCWEHNLDWTDDLMKEYMSTLSRVKSYGSRMVFGYAISQGKKLIKQAQTEYNNDLKAMIKDAKAHKISIAPMPVRMIYKIIKPKKGKTEPAE
jgi:radical SAM superfamily enzyme YgiQ (UPF0313 family)